MSNQTIQIDGKTYKIVLVEPEQELKAYERPKTYDEAFAKVKDKVDYYEVGISYLSEADALSARAYHKLKIIQAALNGDEKELPYCVFVDGIRNCVFQIYKSKDVFNFKDAETARYFMNTFQELLKQFYQI